MALLSTTKRELLQVFHTTLHRAKQLRDVSFREKLTAKCTDEFQVIKTGTDIHRLQTLLRESRGRLEVISAKLGRDQGKAQIEIESNRKDESSNNNRKYMLTLYRDILTYARALDTEEARVNTFADYRARFREHAHEQDPEKVRALFTEAENTLGLLKVRVNPVRIPNCVRFRDSRRTENGSARYIISEDGMAVDGFGVMELAKREPNWYSGQIDPEMVRKHNELNEREQYRGPVWDFKNKHGYFPHQDPADLRKAEAGRKLEVEEFWANNPGWTKKKAYKEIRDVYRENLDDANRSFRRDG
eukprot:63343_1